MIYDQYGKLVPPPPSPYDVVIAEYMGDVERKRVQSRSILDVFKDAGLVVGGAVQPSFTVKARSNPRRHTRVGRSIEPRCL